MSADDYKTAGVVRILEAQANEYDGFYGNDGTGTYPFATVEYLSPYDALQDINGKFDATGRERIRARSHDPKGHGWDKDFFHYPDWRSWVGAVEGIDHAAVKQITDMSRNIIERVVGLASNRVEWQPSRVPAGALDVPAYLAGLPEVFSEPIHRQVPGAGRIVEICINGCASAGVPSETLRMRAVAGLALACAIEAAGGACEIWYGDSYATTRTFEVTPTGDTEPVSVRGFSSRILFKPASTPLDIGPIASWVASADGLRRAGFAIVEYHRPACSAAGESYGRVASLPKAWQGAVPELARGAHYAETQWQSAQSAQEWTEERLRELGVID